MAVRIRGQSELLANFRRLEAVAAAREIDTIMRRALQPLVIETVARAPRTTLKRGVAVRRIARRSRFNREFWVAFLRGNAMRIAHLIEFGTAPHSLAKGASRRRNYLQQVPPFHPGSRAHPFFRPAFETTQAEVFRIAGQEFFDLAISRIQ